MIIKLSVITRDIERLINLKKLSVEGRREFSHLQARGSFTYYVTQKNEILDPPPPCYKFYKEIFFSLGGLLQNLRPPSPLKCERNK